MKTDDMIFAKIVTYSEAPQDLAIALAIILMNDHTEHFQFFCRNFGHDTQMECASWNVDLNARIFVITTGLTDQNKMFRTKLAPSL